MQFEVPLPLKKNLITGPSSEPNESSPYPSAYFRKAHFNIILLSLA